MSGPATRAIEVLARGHGLYGPSATPPQGLGSSAAALDNAARTPFLVSGPASTDSGRAHVGLVDWAQDGNRHLGSLGDDDRNTNRVMQQGAAATGDGRQATGAVLTDARTTAAAMAPWQNLPAGERALLLQMRARLLQQQKQLKLSQAQARQLAARLRNTGSGGSKGSGMGMPSLGGSHGGGGNRGSGGGALSGLSGLSGLARRHRPGRRTALARAAGLPGIPAGPGGEAVAAAATRQGAPYVWGAKGPNQFDCSGLTQWAWRQAGVQLGNDTYTQIKQGVRVPPGQVRAGDLIFPEPGHVMLAVSGDTVIHAPHTGDVVRLAHMPSSFVAVRPVP